MLKALPLIKALHAVIDRVVPNKNERARAKAELLRLVQEGQIEVLLGQLNVNQQEAKHAHLFVSGWRPFIGWACGSAIIYNFIIAQLLGIWFEVPQLDLTVPLKLLLAMLGVAG